MITYIIKCNDFYKIGKTSNIQARLSGIRTTVPGAVLTAVHYGDIEERLHRLFASRRVYSNREFFSLSAQELKEIIRKFHFVEVSNADPARPSVPISDICEMIRALPDSTKEKSGTLLSSGIRSELEKIVCDVFISTILPDIESTIQKAVSSAIAPLLEKEGGSPSGKMTRNQFCERLGVCHATLHNLINSGVLHPQRIGRRVLLDANEVEEKLASGELGKYRRRKMAL